MKERPVYAMVHALRMIELRSPGERDADVIRAAWEWWSDKDVTLKEYEYEGFKRAVMEVRDNEAHHKGTAGRFT